MWGDKRPEGTNSVDRVQGGMWMMGGGCFSSEGATPKHSSAGNGPVSLPVSRNEKKKD